MYESIRNFIISVRSNCFVLSKKEDSQEVMPAWRIAGMENVGH